MQTALTRAIYFCQMPLRRTPRFLWRPPRRLPLPCSGIFRARGEHGGHSHWPAAVGWRQARRLFPRYCCRPSTQGLEAVLSELPCSLQGVLNNTRALNCAGPTVAGSLSWSVEAATFLRLLAKCRARFAPQHSASLTRCRHLGFYATVVCVPRLRSPALFRSQPAIRALHWHVQRPRELPPLSDVLAESPSQPLLASRVV